jgi:c-di-GMP-binding flagellar brake protein YcgR
VLEISNRSRLDLSSPVQQGRKERRQFGSPRITAELRVEILDKTPFETKTVNISQNGVLLLASHSREVNDFVRLRIFLPPHFQSIEILGRVANQNKKNEKETLGIHFIELDSQERNQWLEYVSKVESLTEALKAESSATHTLAERRKTGRTAEVFVVRFKEGKKFEEFITKNMGTGGMFLSTPISKSLGEKVQVVIVHPVTDRTFEMEAEIVRVEGDSTSQKRMGMALHFLGMDETKEKELQEFFQG